MSTHALAKAAVLGFGLALSACSAAPPPKAATATAPQQGPKSPLTAQPVVIDSPLVPVVAPALPTPMAEMARRLAMAIDGAKPQVKTYPIDLASLPRATMHASLDAKEAAKIDRSKLTEDPDLSVKPADGYARSYMLAFAFKDPSKVAYARVRLQGTYGANEGWFGEGYNGSMNTYMTCGAAGDAVPLHWEAVQIESDQVKYIRAEGLLDRQSCRVLRVRHSSATAKALLPRGILYGFRACEGSCADSEELTLVFPRSAASAAGSLGGDAERATGSFSLVSFPIQRGGGGAFVARINRRDAVTWQLRSSGIKEPEKTTALVDDTSRLGNMFLSTFEIGVEVSQTHGDEAPIAIAHMDVDPASLPPPPVPQTPVPVGQAPQPPIPAKSSAPFVATPRVDPNPLLLLERR
jgi:hypothetical protein